MSPFMSHFFYLVIVLQFGSIRAESDENSPATLIHPLMPEMINEATDAIETCQEDEDQKLPQLSSFLESIGSKPEAREEDLRNFFDQVAKTLMGDGIGEMMNGRASLELKGYQNEQVSREVIEFVKKNLQWSVTEKPDEIPSLPIYDAQCDDENSMSYDMVTEFPSTLYFVADTPWDEIHKGPNSPTMGVVSAPCLFYVAQSSIPGAGRGVFTKVDLTPGMVMGPYEGLHITVSINDWNEPRPGHTWSYAWIISERDNMGTVIDGISEDSSNWIRFINMARFEEEQNTYAMILSNEVYYVVYKHILAHTELLVWYGNMGYANWLGIYSVPPGLEFKLVAPPRAKMHCPDCEDLPTVEEVDQMEVQRKEM